MGSAIDCGSGKGGITGGIGGTNGRLMIVIVVVSPGGVCGGGGGSSITFENSEVSEKAEGPLVLRVANVVIKGAVKVAVAVIKGAPASGAKPPLVKDAFPDESVSTVTVAAGMKN